MLPCTQWGVYLTRCRHTHEIFFGAAHGHATDCTGYGDWSAGVIRQAPLPHLPG